MKRPGLTSNSEMAALAWLLMIAILNGITNIGEMTAATVIGESHAWYSLTNINGGKMLRNIQFFLKEIRNSLIQYASDDPSEIISSNIHK